MNSELLHLSTDGKPPEHVDDPLPSGLPDNPTEQEPIPAPGIKTPAVDKMFIIQELTIKLNAEKQLIVELQDELKTLRSFLTHSKMINKEFINQIDREGIGMQTVTDHRKRVDKFTATLEKAGI